MVFFTESCFNELLIYVGNLFKGRLVQLNLITTRTVTWTSMSDSCVEYKYIKIHKEVLNCYV